MTRHFILTILAIGIAAGGAACGGSTQGSATETTTAASPGAASPEASADPVVTGDLDAAIASSRRSEENRARDVYRHPKETLTFFGIEPGMTVVELRPGGGWYTEILAPYIGPEGRVVTGSPSPDGERARYRQRIVDRMEADPELFANVTVGVFAPPDQFELGEPGSADAVLTFRNSHNWVRDGVSASVMEAAFDILKPGGVFGVVQHRADDGTDPAETAPDGYVSETAMIEMAQAAGFVLEERSDINANPNDDHDHPEGVWTLPPVLRLEDVDREEYMAIGESDRMTLRFRKPE